jgi:glycosidase
MPDLNYNNQTVHDSMFSAAEFWLDSMHVDGFRLDAAPYLYDDCPALTSCAGTFQFWQDFHTFYKNINDSSMTVGEVWYPTNTILPYVTGGDKLDFCFEFDLATSMINSVNSASASGLKSALQYDYDQYPYLQFGTFLSNHDQNRVLDAVSGNLSKMKALAATYLTISGIPFVYYGEEIGMTGSGADENKRRPMQWTSGAHAGFTTGNPWEAINSNYVTNNVETESADSNSLLNWYKKLISLRRQEPALRRGNYVASVSAPAGVFSFIRAYENDTDLVIINVANQVLTNFSINVGGSNLTPGYKLFSDLLNGGAYVGSLDETNNLGVFTIGAFGTLVYRLESSTGVTALSGNEALSIFPNPASDVISIDLKKEINHPVSILIQGMSGTILRREQLNVVAGKVSVNINALTDGIYLLKLENENEVGYFKVEVVH